MQSRSATNLGLSLVWLGTLSFPGGRAVAEHGADWLPYGAVPLQADACQNAPLIPIEGAAFYATYVGNTCAATQDGMNSCHNGCNGLDNCNPQDPANHYRDVWYKFQPAATGTVYLYYDGYKLESYWTNAGTPEQEEHYYWANADVVTVSVHTGCPGGLSNEIACALRYHWEGVAMVEVPVTGGDTYWIRLIGMHALPNSTLTDSCVELYSLSIYADVPLVSTEDCNNNGVPDICDLSCGSSGGECQVAGCGQSADCNVNGTPDDCETDCNANDIPDECDLAVGASEDCNANNVPDECEPQDDCNANGVQDICDLAAGGTGEDCNYNQVPDECDVTAGGASEDCNANGQPDECEVGSSSSDCNGNGVPDDCDIANGDSQDANGDGVPDECGVQVTGVSSGYVGPAKARVYFIDGIPLLESFTATVDWGAHPVGLVQFITPRGVFDGSGGGGTWSYTFDIGADFGPGGVLTVIAQSADGTASEPYVANFEVIPRPPGLPGGGWSVQLSNSLKYLRDGAAVTLAAGIPAGTIPDWVPAFGGQPYRADLSFSMSPEITGDGKAVAGMADLGAPSEFAGGQWRFSTRGQATWNYAGGAWQPGGAFTTGFSGSQRLPPAPRSSVIWLGLVPIPVYWQGDVGLSLNGTLNIENWVGPLSPEAGGTLVVAPTVGVRAGVGAADVAAFEGHLGGSAPLTLQYPATPTVRSLSIGLSGSLKLVIWKFTREWPVLDYKWDLGAGGTDPLAGGRFAGGDWTGLSLIPRDYLGDDYAVFRAGASTDSPRGAGGGTVETLLQANVYPYLAPAAAAVGNEAALVWLYDDPLRTSVNGTELVFSASSNGTWSAPLAVADEGTADFAPVLSALPGGDLMAAWENADTVLPDGTDAPTLASHLEIAVAAFDAAAQSWPPQINLTSNGYLDRSPRLDAADNGLAMLVWVGNVANNPLGSVAEPNAIYYSVFDGSSWSAPAVVAANVPSVVKSALAFDGSQARYLYSADMDDDAATQNDRELYALSFDGTAWSSAQRLTNEPAVPDANPQVVALGGGQFLWGWYRGGEIVTATALDLSDLATAVVPDLPERAQDFRLVNSDAGQVALVWQSASSDGVDIWQAVYDPIPALWSRPIRLTFDDSMEEWMAPTYLAGGELAIAYAKQEVTYTTRTLQVGDQQLLLDNVPVPGQSDLYLLRHMMGGDLAIDVGEVTFSPSAPSPGDTVTITAAVRNLGDIPAGNIEVAFYDGDMTAGGVPIGAIQTLAGPLVGGDRAQVSVSWLVPPSTAPRDIYVIVDPNLTQQDRDRTNNTVAVSGVLSPDLAVDSILVETVQTVHRNITVRLVNLSGADVANVGVALRRDAADGPLLATLSFAGPIPARSYGDASWLWTNAAPLPAGGIEVFAIADEYNAVAESDELNNRRSTVLRNDLPMKDCNLNGIDDADEISGGTSQDCNSNAVPDECDGDCNGNGLADDCDLAGGAAQDCNTNGTLDSCDLGTDPAVSVAADGCNAAELVCPGFVYTGSTVNASNDGSSACGYGDGPDVWYRYDPVAAGALTVSLCGSNYDTVVSVHSGCPGGIANELVCNDDACGYQSLVSVGVTPGTSYWIRISGFDVETGDFAMSITGPPCTRDCNSNGVPDECDIAGGAGRDCNGNGVLDECDIAAATGQDCNGNDILDECEIVAGTASDCDGDGLPNDCDPNCQAPPPPPALGEVLVGWGTNNFAGQIDIPVGNDFTAVAAGHAHGVALRADGSLLGWGADWHGQNNAPAGSDYVMVAAGHDHNLALRADGSLIGWGYNGFGQVDVPVGTFAAVAAGGNASAAIRADGSLAAWGASAYGQLNVPAGGSYTAVAMGGYHGLALSLDGSLAGWGRNDLGQADVPTGTGYVAIAAGAFHSLALREDGSLVGWGRNSDGEINAPPGNDYVAVAAGGSASAALKVDGSIVVWGDDVNGVANAPSGTDFGAIALGGTFGVALSTSDCDGDGVATLHDNCLCAPNPDQADCNADGVGDACELAANDCNSNGVPDECDVVTVGSLSEVPFEFDSTSPASWDWAQSCDDCSTGPVPLGFAVQLGGQTLTHFAQDSNGYVELLRAGETPYTCGYGAVSWLIGCGGPPAHTLLMATYDDLTSFYYGQFGYRTDVNRITFYWDTETFCDAGSNLLNTFQIILYADGRVQWNFLSSNGSCWDEDLFSGIYLGYGRQELYEIAAGIFPQQESWRLLEVGAGDCNGDGVPDDCQLIGNDCNTNGIPDDCDIAAGTSLDTDTNGIPDECVAGDLDHDGDVDGDDFALLLYTFGRSLGDPEYNTDADYDADDTVTLVDYQAWLQCYRDFIGNPLAPPPVPGMLGDFDADGDVDLGDFAQYQRCVAGPPGMVFPCVMEFDFDGNQTVDELDCAGLREAFTGP